ncbi:hypothetical protein Catovirus_1_1055 [Catovirus CTV1]|uniref:Uncharacterized protein n=1 Tax=Catovirus CTV1 TaxID=1977631 RepID=A0A1V0SBB3_9VIRU|nr:hypothetical protein Catovirus_1_1055 [Catovirus CTV1]
MSSKKQQGNNNKTTDNNAVIEKNNKTNKTNKTENKKTNKKVEDKKVEDKKVEDKKLKNKNVMPDELKNMLKFNETLADFKNKVDTEIDTLKKLKNELKKIESNYQQDLMKVWKSKKKRVNNGEKTGFIKSRKLPKKLADLIGVEEGTEMSMPTYTQNFYEKVLDKNNLFYEKDKRVFRATKELMQSLGLPESVNNSTNYLDKDGFNFSTLQKHLTRIIKEESEHHNNQENDITKKAVIKQKKQNVSVSSSA